MGRPSKHSKEFKEEAVNLALSTNRSRSDIAASLGVNKGTLGNWIRAAEQAETPPKGSLNDAERDELSRLRKERYVIFAKTATSSAKQPPISRQRRSGDRLPIR